MDLIIASPSLFAGLKLNMGESYMIHKSDDLSLQARNRNVYEYERHSCGLS